jgi:hypothetical protein
MSDKYKYFVQIVGDSVDQASTYKSLEAAKQDFQAVARRAQSFGQYLEAYLFIAENRADIEKQYPEFVMGLSDGGRVYFN